MLEYEKHIEAHRSSISRGAKVTWIAGMCLGEIRTCSTTKCLVSDRSAKRLIQYNLNGLTTCNKYKAFSNSNQSACCLVTLRFLVVVPVPQDTLQRSQALQSPTVQSLEASRVSNKMWQSKHLAKLGLPSCFWAADIATISHIGLILGGKRQLFKSEFPSHGGIQKRPSCSLTWFSSSTGWCHDCPCSFLLGASGSKGHQAHFQIFKTHRALQNAENLQHIHFQIFSLDLEYLNSR